MAHTAAGYYWYVSKPQRKASAVWYATMAAASQQHLTVSFGGDEDSRLTLDFVNSLLLLGLLFHTSLQF